jgi:hypothetical protein
MKYRALYVMLICIVLFVILLMPLRGTLVDDTYIHLVYARNIAELGELSFNPGDPTYGATSPLWVALLAVVYIAGGDLVVWCGLLSALFAIGSIILVYRIVLRISGDATLSAAAALILSAEAWVVRWSAVGMETSFALFMVILALDVSLSAVGSRRRSALFGLLLLCTVLTRPEAILLVPIALAAFLFTRRLRERGGLTWLFVFIPLYIVWLVIIERHTGTYLPLTAGAKQGRLDFSIAMLDRALVPIKIMGATLAIPWLAILAALFSGIRTRSCLGFFTYGEEHKSTVLLMLLWAFALPIVYVILDFHVLSRYLVPVTPAVVILCCLGLGSMTRRRLKTEKNRRVAVVVVAVIVILQNVLFYSTVVVKPTREFSLGLDEVLRGMGRWLSQNSEEHALVAVHDIGAIGYYSGRRILDLGGLVTPEINDMRRLFDTERIIEEGLYLRFEPDYLVDRSEQPDRFSGEVIGGHRFTPVVRGRIANLGIRKPEPVYYVLYAIEEVE